MNYRIIMFLVVRHVFAFTRLTRYLPLRLERSTRIRLHGVLSRSSIINAAKHRSQQQNQRNKKGTNDTKIPVTRNFLLAALQEALCRQSRILEALSIQEQKDQEENIEKTERRRRKIEQRRTEVLDLVQKLRDIEKEVGNEERVFSMTSIRDRFENLGFASLLMESPEKWNIMRSPEYGRPSDFGGLVFYTRLGVPILVGRQGAHADAALRRIAQGTDIWFQVQDYQGSRVLLRSSLVKGSKDCKECRIMAANLAAFYSNSRLDTEPVRVMYTDTRHVAKRGSKRGQLRKKKALGTMNGYPQAVADIANGKEP